MLNFIHQQGQQDRHGEEKQDSIEADDERISQQARKVHGIKEHLKIFESYPSRIQDGLKTACRAHIMLECNDQAIHRRILKYDKEQQPWNDHQV